MHKQHSVEKAKLQAQLAHQLKSSVEKEAEEERSKRDLLQKQAEQVANADLEAKIKIKKAAQVAAEAQKKSAEDLQTRL